MYRQLIAKRGGLLRRFGLLLPLALTVLCGCEVWKSLGSSSNESKVASAQFGVFYGSQLRELDEVPFELVPGRQRIGFRVEFTSPLEAPIAIRWELSKPGKPARNTPEIASPSGRVTKISSATAPLGASRFEQNVAFEPGDPLGLWNIRITAEQAVLIDRPFLVFDSAARRRAKAAARVPDAGHNILDP